MSKIAFSVGKGAGGLASLFKKPAVTRTDVEHAAAATTTTEGGNGGLNDKDVDPLEAFMNEIDSSIQESNTASVDRPSHREDDSDGDVEETEAGEGFVRELDAAARDRDEDGLDDDVDGDGAGVDTRPRSIEPLPPVDHEQIRYEPFRRNFYCPRPEDANLADAEITLRRIELDIEVEGADSVAPVQSFMHMGLDDFPALIAVIAKSGYEAPTAIQAQAVPIILSGHDMLGLAQTGSGKTLAFLLPLLRHCIDQREIEKGDGPIALVLAPTRELATQIHVEAKRFAKTMVMETVLLAGGTSKWEQTKLLKAGCEIVVATPGRLMEHVKDGSTSMQRVTFVVLDEADRMFEMGFAPQVYSILGQIRPDRQIVMFSATFKKPVQQLASRFMRDPVKVVVGSTGQATSEVAQTIHVMPHAQKWSWLVNSLTTLLQDGKVLVFVTSKSAVDELSGNLGKAPELATIAANFKHLCMGIHGDKGQQERDIAIAAFRKGEAQVLVATDVAARGLDIKGVGTVINFDAAHKIETHVHRIGRTGRMGPKGFIPGKAITLLMPSESRFACELVRNLQMSGQEVPPAVLALAQKNPRFHHDVSHLESHGMNADGSWAGQDSRGRSRKGGGRHPAPSMTPGLGLGSTDAHPGNRKKQAFRRAQTSSANFDAGGLAVPALHRQATATPTADVPAQPANTATGSDGGVEYEDTLEGDDSELTALRSRRRSKYDPGGSGTGATSRDTALRELQALSQQRAIAGFSQSFHFGGVAGEELPAHDVAASVAGRAIDERGSKRRRWDNPGPEVQAATAAAKELPTEAGPPSTGPPSRWGAKASVAAASQAASNAQHLATTQPDQTFIPQPVPGRRGYYIPGVRY